MLKTGMWDEPHADGGHTVICTCGWRKRHPRRKVRMQAADRHYGKTGHGWIK